MAERYGQKLWRQRHSAQHAPLLAKRRSQRLPASYSARYARLKQNVFFPWGDEPFSCKTIRNHSVDSIAIEYDRHLGLHHARRRRAFVWSGRDALG